MPEKTLMPEKTRKASEKGLLVTTAETIGKAAGKLAAVSGVKPPAELTDTAPPRKRQKVAAQKKRRLPRRQKKMAKKKSAASTR